jgi:hypothetical protein
MSAWPHPAPSRHGNPAPHLRMEREANFQRDQARVNAVTSPHDHPLSISDGEGAGGWGQAWLLAIPVMLLISPLAWPHYFIILLLPWLVTAAQCVRRQEWNVTAWMLCLAPALLFVNAVGLRLLLPLPRLLPWPAALFVFALPFYTLLLSMLTLVISPNHQKG